jgi:hypothetical protein
VGSYEDFLECMKLYDKAEDGKMLLAELTHILLALGQYMIVTNWFSQTQQYNYDKGGQGYMFRPLFEAIFRLFVVEQFIKFLHMDVSVLWDSKQLYMVIKIHEFTKPVYGTAC